MANLQIQNNIQYSAITALWKIYVSHTHRYPENHTFIIDDKIVDFFPVLTTLIYCSQIDTLVQFYFLLPTDSTQLPSPFSLNQQGLQAFFLEARFKKNYW